MGMEHGDRRHGEMTAGGGVPRIEGRFPMAAVTTLGLIWTGMVAVSLLWSIASARESQVGAFVLHGLGWLLGLAGLMCAVRWVSRRARQWNTDALRLQAGCVELEDFFANAPDMFCTVDVPSGRVVSCNKAMELGTGRSREALIGLPLTSLLRMECAAPEESALRDLWTTGMARNVELRLNAEGDKSLDVELNATAIRDEEGRIVRARVVLRDITEQNRMAEALRLNEHRYRLLFDEGTEGMAVADMETGILLDCNKALLDMVGYERSELIGQSHTLLHAPEDRGKGASRSFEAHRTYQGGQLLEAVFLTKSGARKSVEIKATTLEMNGRKVIQGFFRDVTQRKQVEQALREQEDRYRQLFNGITDGVFVHGIRDDDLPGEFVAVNDALCKRLGYSREELTRMSVLDIDAPESQVDRQSIVRRLRRGESVLFEQTHVDREGRRIPVEIHVQAFQLQGRIMVLSVARDITDRKRAEAQLRILEKAIASSVSAVAMAGEDGRLTYVNPAFLRLWGYEDSSQVLGRSAMEFWESPDEAARIMERLHEHRAWVTELSARRKDGTLFVAGLTANLVQDDEGKALCLMASFVDVTERRDLEARLRQSQKIEAIGQLAGGVAHDFNNILTVILGNAGLLAEQPELDPESRELAAQVAEAASRGANLTRQLLAFSRKQVMQIRALDLNEVLGQILKMLQRVLGEHISLECHYAPELLPVDGDAGMLEQVVMNLAVNARDAMPNGGRLQVRTGVSDLSSQDVRHKPEARPGRFVVLSVTDTGMGMDAGTLARIFEPFFTTKGVGKGTGLGLATVYGIVRQHQGWVEVASEPGRGSTFTVFLPAGVRAPAEAVPQTPLAEVAGGLETILVVEDDRSVRDLVRSTLQRRGYQVLEAENGPAAVRIWRDHGEQIDLLMTDIVMPEGMNGRELAERLRRDRPRLKVLFSSGYSRDILSQGTALNPGDRYLPKPYDPALLAQLVRSILDGR